jgi:uncharacterized protein YjbI with pentapeptide repeats
MFAENYNISSVSLSSWKANNVTNAASMFTGCTNLSTPDYRMPQFDFNKLTDIQRMFNRCSKLNNVNYFSGKHLNNINCIGLFMEAGKNTLANFRVNFQNTRFNNCDLTIAFLNTTRIKSLNLNNCIFNGCNLYQCFNNTNLNAIQFEGAKINNCDLTSLFSNTSNLSMINIAQMNITGARSVSSMFYNAKINNIDINGLDFGDNARGDSFFGDCSQLVSINGLENLPWHNAIQLPEAFINTSALKNTSLHDKILYIGGMRNAFSNSALDLYNVTFKCPSYADTWLGYAYRAFAGYLGNSQISNFVFDGTETDKILEFEELFLILHRQTFLKY